METRAMRRSDIPGRLRIVHVLTHSDVTRGGAIQALLLARGQHKLGHDVTVIANSRPERPLDPTFERWRDAGFELIPYRLSHGLEYLRFRRFLGERRPDVLHAHRDDALRFAYFATLARTPPAFISQRGTTHPFRTRTIGRIHRSRRVHRIIAVAHAVKDALVSYGVAPERVDVVYGSFDLDRFDPAVADGGRVRRELALRADQRLVVQVGALHTKKAPWDFVHAAAKVLESRPDTVFALVGDGKQRKRCQQLLAELQLGDRFRMLGFRSDIADIYAAADVAVNSSSGFEGLTGALREALAMERPVVATRVDGNPEAVKDRETGLLVPAGDPDATARAIVELLDDPRRGRALGQAGRKLILDNMHEEVRLERTEQVYRDVLRERGYA